MIKYKFNVYDTDYGITIHYGKEEYANNKQELINKYFNSGYFIYFEGDKHYYEKKEGNKQ